MRSTTIRRWQLALLTASLIASVAAAQAPAGAALTSAEQALDRSVKAETIEEITSRLAALDMEGRGVAQPGGDKAARYVADRFASLRLKPLGEPGSFVQSIKFNVAEILPETALRVGGNALKFGDEFVIAPPQPELDAEVNGDLVCVGFGVVSPELKRDDLAGVDVKGKIVVLLSGGPPKGIDKASWDKALNPQIRVVGLASHGAAAVILANFATKQQPYSLIQTYLTRRQISLADAPKMPFKVPPIALVSDAGAQRLFAGSGLTYTEVLESALNGESVSRGIGKSASITVKTRRSSGTSSNIIGLLEGSDPGLKGEAMVYSAHYDAYGKTAGGTIYPGAADNALGVGEMTAVAEAFANSKTRPRRSIIFIAFTGEEAGLLGSVYWVNHPTWPLAKVAADLNLDGIGTETYGPVKSIVGFGADQCDAGKTLEAVAAAEGASIFPDPLPEEKVFTRSDHYPFVLKGVPGIMVLGGPGDPLSYLDRAKKWMATDYHMQTDTVRPDWNWQGPRTVASIIAVLGYRLANSDSMPQWLPSSPFRKPREGTMEPPPSPRNE